MDGLRCGFTVVIQRHTNDESDHGASSAELAQGGEVSIESPPLKRCQGTDGDAECIAASQSDPSSSHIKAED